MSYQHHASTDANTRLYRQKLREMVRGIKARTVVDVGGGSGEESATVGQMVEAKTIMVLDHDQECIDMCLRRGLDALKTDLNGTIALDNDWADLILCNQVIEHIHATDTLVAEMYRILRPGGALILCTPNLASWHNIFALIMGYQPFSSQVSDESFLGNPLHPLYKQPIKEAQAHLRVFTARSLNDLLTHHGFLGNELIGVGYYPFGGMLADWLGRVDYRHSAYLMVRTWK